MVTVGAVLSIFTAGEVIDAVFPAPSVAVTVPVVAAPSADRTNGLGVLLPAFTPLASSNLKLAVLLAVGSSGAPVMLSAGAVRSMAQSKPSEVTLLAPSVAVTVNVWAPSVNPL